MSMYLLQLSYTAAATKAMITAPSDRKAAADAVCKAIGGKLHDMYFCFGEYDVLCLIEAPDDKSMAAGSLVVGASGSIAKTLTTKLISVDDAMTAMAMAGKVSGVYKPPVA